MAQAQRRTSNLSKRNPKTIASATDLSVDTAKRIDALFPPVRSRSAKISLLLDELERRDKEIKELKDWIEGLLKAMKK